MIGARNSAVAAAFALLVLAGCGGGEPTGSSTDATSAGGEAEAAVEEEEPVPLAETLQQIQVGDLSMRVSVTGEGPVVLLLHGFPESWYSWRNQIPALAEAGYRVVAPDMRGYGGTDAPADLAAYDIEHLCGDVTGLIDHFGVQRALLVGHDWGAAVAWNCVTLAPDRFRAVAGLSVPTGPRAPRPYTEILRQAYGDNFFYMLYFQEPGVAEAELDANPRELLQRFYTSPDTPREPPEITDPKASAGGLVGRLGKPTELPPWLSQQDLDYYVEQFEEKGFRGGLNYYRQFERNFELTREVDAKIPIPALFIAGAQDSVIRGQSAEQLNRAMSPVVPDLRGVHVIDGAGHWIQQEAAEEVNQLLLGFFGGIE